MATALRRLLVLAFVAFHASGSAQTGRPLTLDVIYGPDGRVNFSGSPVTSITWLDDASYLQPSRSDAGAAWVRVDAASGRTTPLFDQDRMAAALAALSGVSREEAAAAARSPDLTFAPGHTGALVTLAGDLAFFDFRTGTATRVTASRGTEELATFSPDGRRVAFVRDNNLFVADVNGRREHALTRDGSARLLNGKLDWVYQEEIYGRGQFRGFWWSPDSSSIAFLQLDQEHVPRYTLVDDLPYHPEVEVMNYPKAGDPNPRVRLGVARASGGLQWVDLGAYRGTDILVVRVGWTPDSKQVMHQVQDREQTWLDLNVADAASGRTRRVLREASRAWVNVFDDENPVWLDDGSFLWLSERTGFKHLYHYRQDGTQVRAVTAGRWDIRAVRAVDRTRGVVYFTSGRDRHIDTHVYRVALDGAEPVRLSQAAGTHQPTFSPALTQYIDVWSTATTPPQVRLHRADGSELRVIDANPVPALREFRLSTPEFVEVPARDGFVMDAMIIRPPDFDPARRYPVYQFTYAGPGTAIVRNQWGGSQYLFHQFLAQQGLVVWLLDNRSSGGKGVESQWPVYGRLGEVELQDLEDGVAWLRAQPYVDASRIVLSGWSYGGFMTAYAMTHSTSWAAGIAGGPVTDWRNYDTIYTERYMKTPQNNPDGYRRTAPRLAADRLRGPLLLVHGSIDDNVHPQNTMQMAYALQQAGRPFELMVYPRTRHGVTDVRLNRHLRQLMVDFISRAVGSGHQAPDTH